MQTREILLSRPSLGQLLATLGGTPCPLLPQAPCSAKEFLAARQEWEAAGLASLDFDGALHPEPPFDRLLLHLKTGTAVLRLARDGAERLFVRGTVDTAQLRRAAAAEPWRISLRPLSEAKRAVQRALREPVEWELAVWEKGGGEPLAARFPCGEAAARAGALLQQFYGKEAERNG